MNSKVGVLSSTPMKIVLLSQDQHPNKQDNQEPPDLRKSHLHYLNATSQTT